MLHTFLTFLVGERAETMLWRRDDDEISSIETPGTKRERIRGEGNRDFQQHDLWIPLVSFGGQRYQRLLWSLWCSKKFCVSGAR